MSDSEELTILDDIHALECALSQPQQAACASNEPSTSKSNNDIHMIVYDESPTNHDIKGSVDTNKNAQLQKLLYINDQLTNALIEAKNKFVALIEQCKSRQEVIDAKLKTRMKLSTTKHYNWSIAMPYFKTRDCYYAPLNNDAKLKAARDELEIHHLPMSCRWTMRDKNVLLEAIRDEIMAKEQLCNMQDSGKKVLSGEVKKYVGALGEKEFDWMKIGTAGFQNRHTAEECRVMWNVFLHPDINKTKWNKKEDAMLNVLVNNNNCQDWDNIALKLGTKRSGYQCFIRYNNNNLRHNVKSTTWTKEEDDRLKKIVETLKVGNFIPWGEVATYIPERTKQQIYYRWMYNVAPYLKKGRFTAEEDTIFLSALEKYGPNFSRISTFVMPQRTSAQLNDHYNTLHTRETAEKLGRQARSWEYKDDVKLLNLYDQYGTNWSRIAKEFENRTRIQVRHRYSAIKRYENRGIMVEHIPRAVQDEDMEDEIKEVINQHMQIDDIDKELIDYFRGVRIPEANQSVNIKPRKFFSSQELTENVRKLYNILQTLHVNIGRTNCLEQERLAEKDRQLFYVLGEFCRRSANSIERERVVEYYRCAMFGNAEVPKDRYIPPLPFSSLPKVTKVVKRNKNKENTIDYVNSSGTETQLQIEFNFPDTQPYVLEEIGGIDVDEQFEKMKTILMTSKMKCDNPRKKKPMNHKIYILSPEVLNKYILKTREKSVVVINKKNKNFQPMEIEELHDPLNYSWDWITGSKGIDDDANFLYPVIQSSRNQMRREFVSERMTYIKPNYSLLTSYQAILNFVKAYDKEEHTIERFKVSHKGRIALDLLRRRFEILFTYPMYMAKISIQPGIDKISGEYSIWDEDETMLNVNKRRKLDEREDFDVNDDYDDDEIEIDEDTEILECKKPRMEI